MEVKYYVCNHCGNIIEMVKDKGVPVICCGEAMQESDGNATYRNRIIDAVYNMTGEKLEKGAKYELY